MRSRIFCGCCLLSFSFRVTTAFDVHWLFVLIDLRICLAVLMVKFCIVKRL